MDDPFLQALADGGFQVGELARMYHKGGYGITSLDYDEAESQTKELMKQDKVVIFESAIRFNDLFIRIDILIKDGKNLKLIEVKSKSFDKKSISPFLTNKGGIRAEWRSYLYDVAYQKYVLSKAFPEYNIESFLMLVDKNETCQTDGLNQKFKIVKDESNRKGIKVSNSLTEKDLAHKLLVTVPVDEYVKMIQNGDDLKILDMDFEESINYLADAYIKDELIKTSLGAKCAKCEFKCNKHEESEGYISGFKECWQRTLNWKGQDFEQQTVLDLWNSRAKDKYIEQYKYKLSDLSEDDIKPKDDNKLGLSGSERRWLQVEMEKNGDIEPYIDLSGLKKEIEQWKFPLHFIDFETAAPAIPFHKGQKPYQGIAFQYSHHIAKEDGTIEHVGQYLNSEQGVVPSFDFIRHLMSELKNDDGTIFRYAAHENTYLNYIYEQLLVSGELDAEELCAFIQNITKSTSSASSNWKGERCMVDLLELVKRYYYDPRTKGSNSLKFVLPAIMNSSKFLQEKYSKPIYGNQIKSLNFKSWTWVKYDNGEIQDPYKLLPKVFANVSQKNEELLFNEDEISNGGLAMTAYGMMQFSEISENEKNAISKALLQYCELDTFAMVMLYEVWIDALGEYNTKVSY